MSDFKDLRENLIPEYQRESGGWDESKDPAMLDQMTGALNRNALEILGPRQIETAKKFGVSLSLIMIDLDNLKLLNDNFGHVIGDKILRKVAEQLKMSVRQTDFVYRYGGDEFVVIMPGVDKAVARNLIEPKIRKVLTESKLLVSIGISEVKHDEDLFNLIEKADIDLYKEKKFKKNG